MFFEWSEKEVVLRGENPVRLQTLRFEQHVRQDNLTQIAGIGLYSLKTNLRS